MRQTASMINCPTGFVSLVSLTVDSFIFICHLPSSKTFPTKIVKLRINELFQGDSTWTRHPSSNMETCGHLIAPLCQERCRAGRHGWLHQCCGAKLFLGATLWEDLHIPFFMKRTNELQENHNIEQHGNTNQL